jgi:two-component system, cell cycle sensor histidine kinase and response regulator CckA
VNRPLHVLVLDDAHGSLTPLLQALQRDGYSVVCRHVSALEQIASTLDERAWDLVLAIDGLPQNLAFRGLDHVRVRGLDLPFILIVGDHQRTDESRALRAVQAGASDCIEQDQPVRFLAAVERELRQSEVRRERERVENELRMRARQQETVAELGLRALTQKDLVELLDHVMEAVCSTLDVELVGLLEALPGGDTFVLRAGRGWLPGLLGETEATLTGGHETFIGDTLQHGQVVVENLAANGRYTFPSFFFDHRISSALSVALHRQDGPTGCLIACTSRRRMFTRDDGLFLQAVANVLAGALERHTAEQGLLQSQTRLQSVQKMEAIGRLAGGIAHDFNNLVQAIGGYTEILLRRLPEQNPLRRNAEEIKKAGDRAAALTRQLLAFSRQQVLQPTVLDLNTIIANIDQLLHRLIGEDVELRLQLAADLGQVRADAAQIEQVLMNLAVNARDAMSDGGTLTIQTSNVDLSRTDQREPFTVVGGPYVLLAVSDTGCGMAPDVKARAFEPFFTTKEPGRGTGLGLSTVYGIVKQSGGYIWVDSEQGKGTSVRIYLPRVRVGQRATTEVRRLQPAPAPKGSETLLLVEDEEGVRDLIREWLSGHGYEVLTAGNGVEALEVSSGFDGRIDLLLADVVMPQMGGPALAKRLTTLRPETRVIYLSGYADEALGDRQVLEAGAAFLQKPFPLESLVRKVREILDGATV